MFVKCVMIPFEVDHPLLLVSLLMLRDGVKF